MQQAPRTCRGTAGYVPVTGLLLPDQGHAVATVARALGVEASSEGRNTQACRLLTLTGYRQTKPPGYWGLLIRSQLAGPCRELGQQLYAACRVMTDCPIRL